MFWDLDKYYYDDELQEAGLFARQFFSKHKNLKPDNVEDNFKNEKKVINILRLNIEPTPPEVKHFAKQFEIILIGISP